jgi:hypothetical protein
MTKVRVVKESNEFSGSYNVELNGIHVAQVYYRKTGLNYNIMSDFDAKQFASEIAELVVNNECDVEYLL